MGALIIETITANIATELAKIDGTGTWNQALTVIRPTEKQAMQDVGWADMTALIYKAESELVNLECGLEIWDQTFRILVYVANGELSTAVIDIRKDLVAADIHKKLKEDTKRGLSAYCWGTEVGKKEPFHDPGKTSGIAIPIKVRYAHPIGNPYA